MDESPPIDLSRIADETGFTREQVETLLKVQQFRSSVDIAEALALAGVLMYEDVIWYLGSFLMGDREVMAMVSNNEI